ncbi:alpha-L-rhamnosidase [uncultured Selenomonas sp.]|uniref:alpha-L-rhamnosidase n=1 Tax=uncultured Selenomonas sp. TaxID=159275 RepID=UPI0025F8ABCF|nr:alpha-L-rhamnosidase [uncultured Selenomonas sp.]
MKRKWKQTLTLSVLLALGGGSQAWAADFSVTQLEVNHMQAPMGLDETQPVFGWRMVLPEKTSPSAAKGQAPAQRQTAYELLVTDESGKLLWDSGRVEASASQEIAYGGPALRPETSYHWTVRVWDQDGTMQEQSSSFETGLNLKRQGQGDWQGAKWIGSNDELPLDAHRLAVYKLQADVQILPGSTQAGLVFGGNDPRLMEAGKNLWGLSNGKDESWVQLVLDVSGLDAHPDGQAQLRVYRQGYSTKDDAERPLGEFAVSRQAVNEQNCHEPHRLWLTSNHGILQFGVDDSAIELPQVNFWTAGFVVNPAGPGGDYASYPMVGDIGFAVPAQQQARFSHLTVNNYRSPGNAVFEERLSGKTPQSIFQGLDGVQVDKAGYLVAGGSHGVLALADPSHGADPRLRTVFQTGHGSVQKARLYATSRGIYDLYLNGKRVSEDYFAPGLTQYDKTQLYQVYDVTKAVRSGENVLGAQLAEGWWSGAISFQGENWNYFGDRQSLLAKLVITYADGSEQFVKTEPRTWQVNLQGPLVSGSLFQGENYDARRENSWMKPEGWRPAQEVKLDKHTAFFGSWKHCMTGTEKWQDYHDQALVGQEGPSVDATTEVTAQSVRQLSLGVYIYDMGQNLAGVPDITIADGKEGQKLTLRYAEVLYPEGEQGGGHSGELMLENLRGALATDTYTMRAGENHIAPRSTYHGYRYLEISGLDAPLPLRAVRANVLTSLGEPIGSFACSDPEVNRLYQNILWSARANFFSIPTDCPQRNERMGWSGDLSMFARTAGYLGNTDRFLVRHLQAMRDLQDPDGRFGDIAPIGNGFGGILWGSAGMTVPWELYEQYGDTSVLKEHIGAMERYADHLEACVDDDGNISEHTMLELGDWLGPENSRNDVGYLLTAYELYDLDILAHAEAVLGRTEASQHYRSIFQQRQAWYLRHFFDPVTHRSLKKDGSLMDTQTSYAVPLALGILDDTEKSFAAQYLAEACTRSSIDDDKVERPPYSLMTGFIGTSCISKALSDSGHSDIAYKMLLNRQYPSWLYPVEQGATTIWERLNSYTKENGFGGNNSMNSFNHYSFGSVGAWLYNYVLGIQRDEAAPGWQHFYLQPQLETTGALTWARGHYDSPYGRIESGWRRTEDGWSYQAVVPANTAATLRLPVSQDADSLMLTVNGVQRHVAVHHHAAEMELAPGTWQIDCPAK